MQPRTVSSILKDLSKIEYAMRVEGTDAPIIEHFAEFIIMLYRHCIIHNQYDAYLTPDILSDMHNIVYRYMPMDKTHNSEIKDDIIKRMQNILQLH